MGGVTMTTAIRLGFALIVPGVLLAGEPAATPAAPQTTVVIGEYRGQAITMAAPFGADAPMPLTQALAQEYSERERAELKFFAQQARLVGCIRSVVVDHWVNELGVKVDRSAFEAERRRAMKELVGKDTFGVSDVEHLDVPGGLDAVPMFGIIDLLRLHLRDPQAAEVAYERDYAGEIGRDDWEKSKRLHGTRDALRRYAAEVYSNLVNEFAVNRAESRLRETALAKALVAAKRIASEDDLDLWMQGELKYVSLKRLDGVALFIREPVRDVPILKPMFREEKKNLPIPRWEDAQGRPISPPSH